MSHLAGDESYLHQSGEEPHCSEISFREKALPSKAGQQSRGLAIVLGDGNAVLSQNIFQQLNAFQEKPEFLLHGIEDFQNIFRWQTPCPGWYSYSIIGLPVSPLVRYSQI